MTGVLLTLIAVILAGVGARDQVTVAGLSERQGARPMVLVVAALVTIATAALAAWAAMKLAPTLTPKARLIFVAMALAMAGIESLLFTPGRKPEEPTHSLGALAIVLFAHQITDAARFLVFALAVATAAPLPAGVGGAAGGVAVVAAGWLAPEVFGQPSLRGLRQIIGAVLLLIAAILAARAIL